MEGSEHYKQSGVDTAEGRRFAEMISTAVKSTYGAGVIPSKGGFAGLLDISALKEFENPVLVSTTDGVGTKLHLARLFDRHETVGIDLVAMCANDILVTGARPLLFLDYIACGKLESRKMVQIVESVAEGCRRAGSSLMGGETAEHPDLMEPDEYDLGGFMVGAAEREKIIDGSRVSEGDSLISLPSSGIHSNGLSLIRRLFLKNGLELPDSESDRSFLLNQILLKPTLIYEPAVRPLLDSGIPVTGMAHITGGGFHENIPRFLPEGVKAVISRDLLPVPELFQRIRERGKMDESEMFSVFNMGTGMVLTVPEEYTRDALHVLESSYRKLKDAPPVNPCLIGIIQKSEASAKVEIK